MGGARVRRVITRGGLVRACRYFGAWEHRGAGRRVV